MKKVKKKLIGINTEKQVYITDIGWNRTFLQLKLTSNIKLDEIYIVSGKSIHPVKVVKDENEEYHAEINITNLDGVMLENANYRFGVKNEKSAEEEEPEYNYIFITIKAGYKLETLDRVYRYYHESYAYTLNFEIKNLEDEYMTCVMKSKYMKMVSNPRKMCTSGKGHKSRIKSYIVTWTEKFLNALYQTFSAIHFKKKNTILLISETRKPISGNLKALDERLKERGIDKKYKITYSFSKTLEEEKVYVVLKWIPILWKISKQEFIFIDDYSPLFKFINLSKKTKLIQVWHAGVGIKSVGYARFGFGGPEPYMSCHRRYDYAIVGDKTLIPIYEEVFGIPENKILPYGLPRLDNFLDENKIKDTKKKIYDEYPELQNKKIILFAPTFRGRSQKTAYYPYEKLELEKIYEFCEKNDAIFLLKMHPFIQKRIEIPQEYISRIMDISDYRDINELFYITNVLITDYSSASYDFSLLNRPIIFYTFDLDKYQLINKVQRSMEEYAMGDVCHTFDELINSIEKSFTNLNKTIKKQTKKSQNASDLIIDNIILGKK